MADIGERFTEDGRRRVTEDSAVRVSETFNRAQAVLLGTSALIPAGYSTVIQRTTLTTASFTFNGTTMSDSLVPDVTSKPTATLSLEAPIREFDTPARIRTFRV